ncbi:EAL domain-containing protein [Alteromonas sp. ALT199]|uniref:putative bifunctional diguanylate cyclase/phosphodiesterase n=2 Tax=Alteromonas TaxID=226 RepID=UPI0004464C13|nr:EAL domain-containing protein [Alteromonas sp. ALT199]MBT3136922.1 EAL domain-containing protein [Alteromonas sp. ALT199]
MLSTNKGIRKALPILTLTFFLFALLLVWCFFNLTHSTYFHQLNMRHFKYTSELTSLVYSSFEDVARSQPIDTQALRQTIIKLRQQPLDCLSMVTKTDAFVMKMIGTESIVLICARDVETGNKSLLHLANFEQGTISREILQQQLVKALDEFNINSTEFEEPVAKTVHVISTVTLWVIIISSLIVLAFALFISRAVALGLTNREEAMKALAHSEARNKHLAYTDSLTGLPNRNILDHTINTAIKKAERSNLQFAVMFVDLDSFKDVNDTLGHTVGDQLLITMATRIVEALRSNDHVVRFGGDEFVVVSDGFESVETIDYIAHKIADTIKQPVKLTNSGKDSYITASIGVAYYPQNGLNATHLLKHADVAMYQAKQAGKNQYKVFDEQSALEQNRKLRLVDQLHHAISNNELSIAYQPIVRLADGMTVGSEALLRWTNSDNETISPAEFIPIAEHSGQILDIGYWVLEQACKQCKEWHNEGAHQHAMAINVSSHQLKDPHFTERLKSILEEISLPASFVHLEVTENSAITEDPACVATLHQLAALGTRLLLDDFGTGYSCLSYLKDLPFHILKIDKSFMPADNTIASTIIAMGHEMNMPIVAEGIEAMPCYAHLKALNCQYGQGFLFQKPVPAHQFDTSKYYECFASPSN